MAIFPHSSSISVISLMLLPDMIQDISSTKDNSVAPFFCSTLSNTLEMYIANRIVPTLDTIKELYNNGPESRNRNHIV
jgi:hypothetical protein